MFVKDGSTINVTYNNQNVFIFNFKNNKVLDHPNLDHPPYYLL